MFDGDEASQNYTEDANRSRQNICAEWRREYCNVTVSHNMERSQGTTSELLRMLLLLNERNRC